MKNWMKWAAPALAACLTVAAAGCGSHGGLREKGKLTMATEASFEPFEYMEGGKVVGIDVDMANLFAKDLGAELSIDNINFDSVVPAVSTGKADVGIAGISKNADREKMVDFSVPYYDASQVLLVRSDNTAVTGKDDLKGKKIAVQKGTTGDDLATKLTGDANVVRFNATTDAITELKNGKCDAVVLDSFPAKVFVKQNPQIKIVGEPMTSESYCVAVKKGNKELLDKINATIEKIKQSGELDKIMQKYS